MRIKKQNVLEIIGSDGELIGKDDFPKNGSDLETVANNTTDRNARISTQPYRYDMLGRFGFTLMPFMEGENSDSQKKGLIDDLAELMYEKFLETLQYYYKNPSKLKSDFRLHSGVDFDSQPEDKRELDYEWAWKVLDVFEMHFKELFYGQDVNGEGKERDAGDPENNKVVEDFVITKKNDIEISKRLGDMDIRDKKIEKVVDLIDKLSVADKNKLIKLIEKRVMNSELYGKKFSIPPTVLKYIKSVLVRNPKAEGSKRAKHMLENGVVTYQELKRLKNFFDYYDSRLDSKIQYALSGGDLMRDFVENTLNKERHAVKIAKDVRRDVKSNPNSELKAYRPSKIELDEYVEAIKENVVAVILNREDKILLIKRGVYEGKWMPNKWALIGGKVENGESWEESIIRETYEETGLKIDNFVYSSDIRRFSGYLDHIFVCRYLGNDDDVVLNRESLAYGWFDIDDIKRLDTVPYIMDYINAALVRA